MVRLFPPPVIFILHEHHPSRHHRQRMASSGGRSLHRTACLIQSLAAIVPVSWSSRSVQQTSFISSLTQANQVSLEAAPSSSSSSFNLRQHTLLDLITVIFTFNMFKHLNLTLIITKSYCHRSNNFLGYTTCFAFQFQHEYLPSYDRTAINNETTTINQLI